jgi:CubicO group peptidase (beta-lactamase class C family)
MVTKNNPMPNYSETMSYKVNSICMKVIPLSLFLLFFQPVFAQYNWTSLDTELDSKKQLLGNNLVAIVVKGDSLLYKKELGDFNSKTQAPIASCSKWLTAVLVMQIVDEGKLSLEDRVAKYIPEFDKYFKGYITIRQCLSHMTGIDDDDKFLKRILERRKYSSLEEEVNDFAKRDIRAKPGTDFWYGNVGLNIAGRVLEVITKKKFDMLIKTTLFNPLGMTRTTFTDPNGHAVNPSGGAISTADDYMKFLVMMLGRGKYNGKQILSDHSFQELLQVQNRPEQIAYAPKAAGGLLYALGSWVVESKNKEATALASPGLFGTWPMVDWCRGYAMIIFVKNFLGEQRAEEDREIKKIIDAQLGTCH